MPRLWRLTVRELGAVAEGYQWRDRQAWERQAWLASVLLRAWVQNAPSPQQLLGDPSAVDAESAFEELTGGTPSVAHLDAAYARQARLKAGNHGAR